MAVGVFIPNAHSATITVTADKNEEENFRLNSKVLENVTGIYQNLEVINSGSVFELDKNTVELIKKVCKQRISTQFILSRTIFTTTELLI